VSVRSFQRAHIRRQAREQRRASTLRRKGSLVAGLALSSTALFAANAQAADYTVTTTGDGPAAACSGTSCTTLRDALNAANGDGTADTISLSGVSGTITLTNGTLPITNNQGLAITGPGAGNLTVDANHLSQAIYVHVPNAPVSITGLTITNGTAPSGTPGGAIGTGTSNQPALTLTNDVISNSTTADTHGGGGIFSEGDLTLTGSTVSGNSSTAVDAPGGGISGPIQTYLSGGPSLTVTNSTISGNTSNGSGGGIAGSDVQKITGSKITDNHLTGPNYSSGGGIDARTGFAQISGTTISGNTSNGGAGGIFFEPKYGGTVSNSVVSGNTATGGGGGLLVVGTTLSFKYSPITVENSTISGNQANGGAGIYAAAVLNKVSIVGSTLSGNTGSGTGSIGGGLFVGNDTYGKFEVSNSTISGNTASIGGGASIGYPNGSRPTIGTKYGSTGAINFDNSTIAANTGTAHAGGIYLSQYQTSSSSPYQSGTVGLTSTIVGGNTAAGISDDLERGGSSTTGGFNGAFSLVQSQGNAPLTKNAVITGISPQLGALDNNGGSTETMLPAGTSPVIDQGKSPASLTTDQRGLPRLVDTAITNPVGGDGTDIGAVELPASSVVIPPPPPTPPTPPTPTSGITLSIHGASLSLSSRPLLVGNQTPVTCAVKTGTLNNCVIEVQVGGKVLGSGEAISPTGVKSLTTQVTPTKAGLSYLKHRQLGVDATATLVASQSAAGSPVVTGNVHFLQGPSITLGLGSRSASLSKNVVSELNRVAKLLAGTKSFTCTAYSDKGKHDVSLTKSQAGAACTRLKKDGLSGKSRVVGRGHANPVASNQNRKGRAANRRLVISFTF
jgi:hypothetical protein